MNKRRMLPYSTQSISEADIQAVARALRSSFLTQGPAIEQFERAIARYTGARFCVALSTGTAALHAAYFAAGIGKDDEVIMPGLTFAATGNAALYLGARPVFADINFKSGTIDPNDVEKKITPKTKAIVSVDYAGAPADIAAMRRIAKKHKLIFIEDAAQGLGGSYKGKKLGSLADMTMLSFHPVKSITTGEGGVITTNSSAYAEKVRMFRSHGLTRDPKRLKNKTYAAWHQEMQILGYNYRLTDFQAALGTSQMKKLDQFVGARRKAVARYFALLAKLPGIKLPPREQLADSAWHLFVVHIDPRVRDRVFTDLRKAGIGVQVHYLPVYLHPYYQALGYKKGECPNAEAFSFSALSLPLFPGITNREQSFVVRELEKAFRRA